MRKFAVTLTKGNKVEVLETFNKLEDALQRGEEVAKDKMYNGLSINGYLACESANFADDGKTMQDMQTTLYRGWEI